MDVVLLSRIQFALTISFHYIFPPLSIGLSLFLVFTEALFLKTGNPLYERITRFWVKLFSLIFVMGVATGVVMEFQFGTNWAAYSRYVGDVFGSALAAEGILAFFLESTFLAVLVFGWDRVSPRAHFLATVMVAAGSALSAVWIVVANSWMQTPAGFHLAGTGPGTRAEITDFWALVFNPSSMERLSHVFCGAWQAGAWLVVSVSAFYLLKKRHVECSRISIVIGLVFALGSAFAQLATGHVSAMGVARNQPAKLAAFEGHFEANAPAPMYLIGWADGSKEKVLFGIGLPGMLSLMVHLNPETPVKGLKSFPRSDWPPVNLSFQAYHVMVLVGMGLIGLGMLALFFLWRGKLFGMPWLLALLSIAFLGPQVANQTGWMAAEVGRQPWIVYGILRTRDAVSKVVSANEVLVSLALFGTVYALLFGFFVFLFWQKIKAGPEENDSRS